MLPSSVGDDGRSATEPDDLDGLGHWESQGGHFIFVRPLCPCAYRERHDPGDECPGCGNCEDCCRPATAKTAAVAAEDRIIAAAKRQADFGRDLRLRLHLMDQRGED